MKSLGGKSSQKRSECGADVRPEAPLVVLLSGTGEGKSTSACVISGDPALAKTAEEAKVHSETSESCVFQTSWYDHGDILDIVDTPGFGDSRGQEVMQANNEGIVETLRHAGRVHAVLWVLNYDNQKMNKGRKEAFRFVRTYFGQKMYDHLVFVYTHFSWKVKKGRKKYQTGEERAQALAERHANMMQGLMDEVEKEFWPNGDVSEEVSQRLLSVPHFGINTYVLDDEEDGVILVDEDLPEDAEETNDIVYQEEAYGVSPNSASQVRDLKEAFSKLAKEDPIDVRQLRDLHTSCAETLKDSQTSDLSQFGQHLCDCFEGQLFKLLDTEVVPHVKNLPEYGAFVAFAVKSYREDSKVDVVEVDIMDKLGIASSEWQVALDFHDYTAYKTCDEVLTLRHDECSAACMAQKLGACFQGTVSGKTPPIWSTIKEMFSAGRFTAQYISEVKDSVQQLDDSTRGAVEGYLQLQNLMSVDVQISIQVNQGMQVSTSRISMSAVSSSIDGVKMYVYDNPLVKSLKEKGWLKDISLMFGDHSVYNDEQLQQEVTAQLSIGDKEKGAGMTAFLEWVPGTPPYQLSPDLFNICLKRKDILAAESLVQDHVVEPKTLALANDLEQILPYTKGHGSVYQELLVLREEEQKKLRGEKDTERENRMQDKKNKLDEIDDMRERLQKYIDEMKQAAADRKGEAQELKENLRDKVGDFLSSVKGSDLKLPQEVPDIDDPKGYIDFAKGLEIEFTRTRGLLDKEVLPAADLVMQSKITKGWTLGDRLEAKAQELVTVTSLPPVAALLTPASAKKTYTMTSQFKGTYSYAKQLMKTGGESWATSFEASGAGLAGYTVMAGSVAAQIGKDIRETSELTSKGRDEESTYMMYEASIMPMKLLELSDSRLRLATPFLLKIAKILDVDEKKWHTEIGELFDKFGTHYCPSVELGGIWMREGEFSTKKSFSESQGKSAISKCFTADTQAAMSVWSLFGGGSTSGALSSETCSAEGEDSSSEVAEFMQSTSLKRECISNLDFCPNTEQGFSEAMQANFNWAVIDRKMGKCLSVWSKLNEEIYVTEITGLLDNATDVNRRLFNLRQALELEWHFTVLNLVGLCTEIQHHESSQSCDDLQQIADSVGGMDYSLASKIINKKWPTLKKHIAKLKKEAQKRRDKDVACTKLSWCYEEDGRGTCKWMEKAQIAECDCKSGWGGKNCGKKLPNMTCQHYTKEMEFYKKSEEKGRFITKFRLNAKRWLLDKGIQKCREKNAEYAQLIAKFTVDDDGSGDPRFWFVCNHTEDCTPTGEGEDCCKRIFGDRLKTPTGAMEKPDELDDALKAK